MNQPHDIVYDKVLRAVESNPRKSAWLNKFSEQERENFLTDLAEIYITICAASKSDMLEKIPEMMTKVMHSEFEIREPHYRKVLEEALEELANGFEVAIGTQKDVNVQHERRISSLEHRVGYVEHLTASTKTSIESNALTTNQVLKSVEAIADRLDNMPAQNSSEHKWLKSIPWQAWAAGGMALASVLIFVLTGETVTWGN